MFRRAFLASLVLPCSSPAGLPTAAPPVIERSWLGPAERYHGHDALGIGRYPGRVHAIVRDSGRQHAIHFELAGDSAFEDGLVRSHGGHGSREKGSDIAGKVVPTGDPKRPLTIHFGQRGC